MEDLRNSINASSELQDIRSQLIQAQGQMSKMYSEEDLKSAWEDGRNETKTIGIYPFYQTIYKNQNFTEWFTHFKKK